MGEHEPASSRRPDPADATAVPVASMVESIVGCKWSVRLLQLCAEGNHRPSALLRACTGLSAKVLNERLRKMTRFGIMHRTVHGEKPPVEVEYRLTPFGRRFMGILEEVQRLQQAVEHGAIGDAGEAAERTRWGHA
ncbi:MULTISPECIES: winged helix-turn-helix transcriptional regulator [Rhodanobacter]|uniref:winged helix-turn-helix transcriptional regulator n=1 Tax=Rhodanobacter TaxID=75309 RepID=UPI0003FA54BD|nr:MULTISPECIES: winged helix-turn-helix transcriptional regulator [Rhodanobacter]TAN19203.1 MAG: HxlR family transcriptional regulator [Rhodanobacter sp.]UJJ53909.1 winged helix-turn-helix transcriptional regulator [Rhodanobacter thiooxydans]